MSAGQPATRANPHATRAPRVAAALDIRLALGAVVGWLALIWCLGRSAQTVLVVSLAAVSVAVAALVAARRGYRYATAAALVGFSVGLVLIPFAARISHARESPIYLLAQESTSTTVVLTAAADPRTLTAKGTAGAPRAAIEAEAESVFFGGRTVATSGSVLVLGEARAWNAVMPGQRIRISGMLRPALDPGSLSVTLFAQGNPELIGKPPWWQRAAGQVRSSLRSACAPLSEPVRGLLPGLVDGDVSGLDPVLNEHFRLAGLTHLVAVSGTNCAILVGVVLLVLRQFRVRPWGCALAGALVLAAFVLIARPSPSVLRAAVMALIALVALASGRPKQALPALAAAVLSLLVYDPQLSANAGFAMSVLATGALLIIAPGWAQALRSRRVPVGVAEALAVAAAAHLVTAPVIVTMTGQVSLVAIPANVLAEPVVAAATVFGFAAALLSVLWLPGAQLLAWLASWPCRWLAWDADEFGSWHGAVVPWPAGVGGGLLLLAALAALVLAFRRSRPRQLVAAAGAIALLVQIPVRAVTSAWPPPGWLFVACDVGQGDALLLAAGEHSAVVIDAGPDPVKIDRCLSDLAITAVPLLLFSHFHVDHVAGVAGIAHGRRIGQVMTGPLAEPASGVALVTQALAGRGVELRVPAPGSSFHIGQVHLEVLGPTAVLRGTRSDPNNDSLIVRATVGGIRILLPGDAEVEEQQEMVESGVDVSADILKVPHHGSAYSSPAFLAAVHAQMAVVSCGLHNDYGHPSAMLLGQMQQLGVPLRRTDQDGDIAISGALAHLSVMIRGSTASAVGS